MKDDSTFQVRSRDRVVIEIDNDLSIDAAQEMMKQVKDLWPDNEIVIIRGRIRVEQR